MSQMETSDDNIQDQNMAPPPIVLEDKVNITKAKKKASGSKKRKTGNCSKSDSSGDDSSDGEIEKHCDCKKELIALVATVKLQQTKMQEQSLLLDKLQTLVNSIVGKQQTTATLADKVTTIEKSIDDKLKNTAQISYSSLFTSSNSVQQTESISNDKVTETNILAAVHKELQDKSSREGNLLIMGVKEAAHNVDRQKDAVVNAEKIFDSIGMKDKIKEVYRFNSIPGSKFTSIIKVKLKNASEKFSILKAGKNLNSNVGTNNKIFLNLDLTMAQRNKQKNLIVKRNARNELLKNSSDPNDQNIVCVIRNDELKEILKDSQKQ